MTPGAERDKPAEDGSEKQGAQPQDATPKDKSSPLEPETPEVDSQPGIKPDPKPQGETSPLTGAITVEARKIEAENVVWGQQIRNTYHFESNEARFEILWFDMAKELPISKEEADAKIYIHEERVTAELLERLQDRRVLCLYGEPSVERIRRLCSWHICFVLDIQQSTNPCFSCRRLRAASGLM